MTPNIELLPDEIFKTHPKNTEYLISTRGRIYSKMAKRLLKPRINEKGYATIHLSISGRAKCQKIHRIVMETFVGPSSLTVNHINEIKTDNRLENLEYLHSSENTKKYHINRKKEKLEANPEYPKCDLTIRPEFKGYYFEKSKNSYRISVPVNDKMFHLHSEKTEDLAKIKHSFLIQELQEFGLSYHHKPILVPRSTKKALGSKCWTEKEKVQLEFIKAKVEYRMRILDF